uniref:Solute carrier family 38 member 5b n=1 Tax=Nothobranchius furzeri TaxID=105023 RepID=A0A8C6L0S6_NOTFU
MLHDAAVEGGIPPEEEKFLQHKEDGMRPQFTDFEGKTSFGMSVFNLSNAIMGSGILGLSYAMSNTGIVLFLILLTCIACLSCYSVHLLLRSAGVIGIRAYEQLGFRAFGHPGKIIAAVVITLHNIGAMSSYLFIVKYELPLVIQAFLDRTQICGFSLSCMVFFLSAVIYKKFNIACPLEVFGNHSVTTRGARSELQEHHVTAHVAACVSTKSKINLRLDLQTAYTIPILAFAFVCHPEVLPIYTELRNPTKRRMQNIGNVSILGMFIMYFFTAVFGYLTFFENTEAELLHTYSKVDPLDTLILCVRLAVLVAVTLTVPVVLFPIRRALMQLLFPGKSFHWLRHIAIAVCLLFAVNLMVIFVPNIRDIFGISGATTAPTLIFILPGLFYIRIVPKNQEPMSSRPKIQAACFSALGFIFMIMSLTFIGIDWMSGEKRNLGGH